MESAPFNHQRTGKTRLWLANVDLEDRRMVAEIRERDLDEAETRIRNAVQRLRDLGIIDETGRRTSQELPFDMRPGSANDFGG